jgi:SPP1 family predicted phage head-tail adaptor
MYFSEKVTLRSITIEVDDSGFSTEVNHDVEVWADKKTATRTEFYSAHAAGIEVSAVFTVNDYSDEKILIHQAKEYDIVRAYRKGEGEWELTCSDRRV